MKVMWGRPGSVSCLRWAFAACSIVFAGVVGATEHPDEAGRAWPQAERRVDADGGLRSGDGSKTWVPAGRYDQIVPAGRVAIVAQGPAWGLIDANGVPLTAVRFQEVLPFGERDAPQGFLVTSARGQSGVLDADGRVVTDATWSDLRPVELWPDDPSRRRWFFEVRQGHRRGVLDESGNAVLPVHFRELSWVSERSPMVIVEQGRLQGVCNVLTGECPLPLSGKRYERLDDQAHGTGLLTASWVGKVGLLDEQLREVLPPWYDTIETVGTEKQGGLRVLASLGLDRLQFVLQLDDAGRWSALKPDRPWPQAARRDEHPAVRRQWAVIDARYLPLELSEPGSVERAHVAKRLRELRQPSIQLSAWTAYVGFDLFDTAASTLPQVWTRCPDPVGVRLVAWQGQPPEQAQACASRKLLSVHLKPGLAPDGTLFCEGCEALGAPQHWVRRDEPPVDATCVPAMTPWRLDDAKRDYARWLAAWMPTWRPVLQGKEPSKAAAEVWRQHQADPSRAMSTLMALLRRPESLLQDIGLDAKRGPKAGWGPALTKWLSRAVPVGGGGLYPEPEVEFASQCAEVWYLSWPELAQRMEGRPVKAGTPLAHGLRVPPPGVLERQSQPFLTFARGEDGGLQLTGISREFLQAVWLLEGGR